MTAPGSAGSGSQGQKGLVWSWEDAEVRHTRIGKGSKDHFPGGCSCLRSDSRDPKGTMTTPRDSFNPWGCCQQFPLHKPKPQMSSQHKQLWGCLLSLIPTPLFQGSFFFPFLKVLSQRCCHHRLCSGTRCHLSMMGMISAIFPASSSPSTQTWPQNTKEGL